VFEELDELARGLAENDISRRQAIKWAGYSVLGATLSSMGFADTVEALTRKARRRCRRKGGTPLERGECHCGIRCDTNAENSDFICGNTPNVSARRPPRAGASALTSAHHAVLFSRAPPVVNARRVGSAFKRAVILPFVTPHARRCDGLSQCGVIGSEGGDVRKLVELA
jgi:hypothetical protein